MENSNKLIRMTLTLSVIVLISMIFSALALSDIYNNEANLQGEWNVIRTSFLFTLMFVALSFITILKIRKSANN